MKKTYEKLPILTPRLTAKYKKALTRWYREGKTKGFFEIQKKFSSVNTQLQELEEKLNKGLLTERNKRFSRRIDILLQSKPELSYFFAIGAGHLVGEEGLLTQLRLKGYKVSKVHK